ncbi:hypothetical protein HED60_08930 [Planctomycetales bacterium ZRK34]|nr:hypothetical protein HED60_08930 [Planctomycetales bacterium ZRK34]
MARRQIIIVTIVASAVLVAGSGVYLYRQISQLINNAYAKWHVAALVIDHMKVNNDAWPTGWDDLRDDFDRRVTQSGQSWSFDTLRERVVIDWTVDPEKLAHVEVIDDQQPFNVIRARHGIDSSWEGAEPNRMILDYLRQRSPKEP